MQVLKQTKNQFYKNVHGNDMKSEARKRNSFKVPKTGF
jgi:hypothetical protein